MEVEDTDLDDQSKAVMLFGRDIRKVPCFKNSMLFGIYSGLATGLTTFMFTSRVKLTTQMTLGSYMAVSMGYWFFCRYTYVKNKYAITELQQIMQQARYTQAEEQKFLQDNQKEL